MTTLCCDAIDLSFSAIVFEMDSKEYFLDMLEDKDIRIHNKTIEKIECCCITLIPTIQRSFLSRFNRWIKLEEKSPVT